jgi:hypothetical protein
MIFVEGHIESELRINPVEMALVEFPPLDGTRPGGGVSLDDLNLHARWEDTDEHREEDATGGRDMTGSCGSWSP